MTIMRNTIIYCLLLLGGVTIHAQVIITPFGGSSSNAEHSVSFTSGEAIISTVDNNINVLTQGFQQPDKGAASTTSILDEEILNGNADLTQYELLHESEFLNQATIDNMLVFDVSGKILFQKSHFYLTDFRKWWAQSADSESLIAGIYFYYIEYKEEGLTKTSSGRLSRF